MDGGQHWLCKYAILNYHIIIPYPRHYIYALDTENTIKGKRREVLHIKHRGKDKSLSKWAEVSSLRA